MIHRNWAVDVVVELRELVNIIPYFLVAGVEDMGAVLVDVDPGDILGIDVSGDVIPAVNHQTAFPLSGQLPCEYGAIQPGADD